MKSIPATVGILTFNSAKTLRRALESVADFQDIIICDGGSTDETLAIAASFNARVVPQDTRFQNENGSLCDYAGVRNQCIDAARFDWFLYIDSDEEVTQELLEEVRSIVAQEKPPFLIYNVSPRIVLDGTLIKHSSNYPGWQKRFFNRTTGARFRKSVHERIYFDETTYSVGFLAGNWLYFISGTQDGVKNRMYAYMDAAHHAAGGFSTLAALLARRCIILLKSILKITFNRLRFGSKGNMPLALEFTRIQYHLYFMRALVAYSLSRNP